MGDPKATPPLARFWQHNFFGEAADRLNDLDTDIDAMRASLEKIGKVAEETRAAEMAKAAEQPAAAATPSHAEQQPSAEERARALENLS